MVNQILHYLHAKQMYDMQKNQGMAGLVGILSVLLIVWKWNDWFYPVLDSLGLVAFAERTGMLHPDMPVMSVINVVAVIVFLMLLVTVSAFLYLIGIMFLAVFAQSKIGALILGITLLPFFYIFSILNRIITYPMRVLKERQREKEWQIESAAYFKRLDRQNGDHIQDPIFRKWIDEIHDKYGKNNLTRAMIYAQRRKELKLECDVIVESTKEEIEKILCRMSPDFFSEDTRFMLLFTPSNNPNIIDLLHALLPSPNPGVFSFERNFSSWLERVNRNQYSHEQVMTEVTLFRIIPVEVIEDEHKIDKLGLSYKNITGTTIGRIDKDNIGFRVNGFSLAVDFDNMAKGFPELKEFYHLEVVKHYVIKEFLTRNTEHYLNPYLYILHDVPNSDVLYHTYLPYIKEEMWKLSREGHTFATDWLNDLELV